VFYQVAILKAEVWERARDSPLNGETNVQLCEATFAVSAVAFSRVAWKVLGLYLERPREKVGPWALQIQRLEGSLNGCQFYGL